MHFASDTWLCLAGPFVPLGSGKVGPDPMTGHDGALQLRLNGAFGTVLDGCTADSRLSDSSIGRSDRGQTWSGPPCHRVGFGRALSVEANRPSGRSQPRQQVLDDVCRALDPSDVMIAIVIPPV